MVSILHRLLGQCLTSALSALAIIKQDLLHQDISCRESTMCIESIFMLPYTALD